MGPGEKKEIVTRYISQSLKRDHALSIAEDYSACPD